MDVAHGSVARVDGPVVEATGLDGVGMLEHVEVGAARLPAEVIALENSVATLQVYEYTGGLKPGDPVVATGGPLTVELGPGLLGGVFDGMLRRLEGAGRFLDGATRGSTLPIDSRWAFEPELSCGAQVEEGAILGRVQETSAVEHRVLSPPGCAGRLESIATPGSYTAREPIAVVDGRTLTMASSWPVRRPRPSRERLAGGKPLVTGQRVLDLLFPIARGGTAAIPGGFGTGKTVLLQQIAKWCDADVIVYVGCGERGNELADVLDELGELEDPRTGRRLLERTVLIANTSNMPVMAREASIYTGATVAEFFRDMGHDVVLIADSTSRWAEALREVSGRIGQLPAEEGYPPGLASALAAFYERAGMVRTLSELDASTTILGAVSPPGGDLAEPVTAHTRRFVRCVWSLDRDLAYGRQYPAVRWQDSSSRDARVVGHWQTAHADPGWAERRATVLSLLADAERIESVAQLVGAASLPARERIVMLSARLLREAVLYQSALSENDAYCSPEKQTALLTLALDFYDACEGLVERGVPAEHIEGVDVSAAILARERAASDDPETVEAIAAALLGSLGELG